MKALRTYWSEHPISDLVPVMGVGIVASLLAPSLFAAVPASTMVDFLGATAGVSGLAFAAGTFVCTMTYQSTNFLMSDLRKTHHAIIRRNWVAILSSLLAFGILACLAMLLTAVSVPFAAVVGLTLISAIAAESFRAIWWLRKTLFVEDAAMQVPQRIGYDKRLLRPKH